MSDGPDDHSERGADRDVDLLARRCGIQRRYVDGMRRRRVAPLGAVRAALRAMGVDLDGRGGARQAIRRIEAEESRRLCQPVAVHWIGSGAGIALGPAAARAARLDIQLIEESGRSHRWIDSANRLDLADPRQPRLPAPRGLAPGMARLVVSSRGRTEECALLVAPPRCVADRDDATEIGVFLPLHAVRSRAGPGVGTLGDLARLVDWADGCGVHLVGTLPLLATFLDGPFVDPSPYAPASRSIFGELFVDLDDAARRLPLRRLRRLLASTAFATAAARLRRGRLVDYRASWELVRRGLEAAATDLFAVARLRAAVESLAVDDPLIAAYARFRGECAAKAAAGAAGARRVAESEERLYLAAQWLLAEQLRRASVGAAGHRHLYLDLPVGTHAHGFDAWRSPGLHAPGVSMGAPPDSMFHAGQSWGFPPVIPHAARASGHADLASALDRHLRVAAALRIDHAAGLHRSFWVPEGRPATDGLYVGEPAEERLALLSIASHRHRAVLVAENLGTVPREVNASLRRRGLLRMSIAQFELGRRDRPLPRPERPTLAALNTHDMPTFAAFWTGADIDLHIRLGVLPAASRAKCLRARRAAVGRVAAALVRSGRVARAPTAREALEALLAHLAEAGPRILLVNLEDLWLETLPQNVPGIVEGFPNWRRRAARPLVRIAGDASMDSLLRRLVAVSTTRRRTPR